ncbi:MAG: succinate--CoA ligase subunit alpha [Candidatus Dormibacteria bacterium]
MSVLVNRESRVVVQGMTGREGTFHTEQMIAYGTRVVAGVSPGKGGSTHLDVPVFNTVADAVAATGADVSAVFVPPPFAADAVMEGAAAGVRLVVCITEGVPVSDMMRANAFLRERGVSLVGPNCPGLMTLGEAKVGIIPNQLGKPGDIGLISRSGTLTYEVMAALSAAGFGFTTCVGIGGDPIPGLTFRDVAELFVADPKTQSLVVLGEIGGSDEETVAEFLHEQRGRFRTMAAFIGGRTAPEGKRMGHAGAIVTGNKGTAKSKVEAFEAAGVPVAETIEEIVEVFSRN